MSQLVSTTSIDLSCGLEGCTCRPRTARVDFYAFRVFREVTGKSLLRGLDLEQLDDAEIVGLVYASLKHEDPDLTIEHIERHLTPANVQVALLSILALYNDAFAASVEGAAGDPLTQGRPA